MAKSGVLFLIFFFYPGLLAQDSIRQMIVWNVGQGQWATHVMSHRCDHFDMGGEFAPLPQVVKECGNKQNRIFLSHWDMDHIGFVRKAARVLPQNCLGKRPKGRTPQSKAFVLEGLQDCEREAGHLPEDVQFFSEDYDPLSRVNNMSNVFTTEDWLIPGDSPQKEERRWIHEAIPKNHVKVLLLGHHGSRTSTSAELLNELPELQVAISSARKHRFGHPHRETIRRLEQKGIHPLQTESFGHLRFREAR